MNLLSDIQQQIFKTPGAVAMRENQRAVNYHQLGLKLGAVRNAITTAGIPSQSRIGLAMDRSIDAACGLLGILSAGSSYIPMDLSSPAQRQRFIIQDADVAAVIGSGECPENLQPCNWLNYDDFTEQALQLSPIHSEQLAAILYTSGSTGTPKGVALSHRAILAFRDWARQLVNLNHSDRIASLAPFYFDLSTFDIFASLSVGACVDFVPKQLPMAPSQLSRWLLERQITGFYTVPSVLGFLALKGNLKHTALQQLRFLLFAGEVFATPLLKTLMEHLPDSQLYNLYGPTETNVCVYWQVNPDRLDNNQSIPIGQPACGNSLRINPETAELLVKGPSVFNGYWNQGCLHVTLSEQGWYSTGDKVSINEYGEYCYHGRLDRMLKCSGFRVEPAEIEHKLQCLPGVIDCAVVGINDETAGQRPVAAVVLKADTPIQQLRKSLIQELPHYMIPARWKAVSELPLLANGKIDYISISNLFDPPYVSTQ